MTAPDSLCFAPKAPGSRDAELIRILIEDALDPAHLALIAVHDWDLGTRRGISLQVDVCNEPGSAMAALQQGACDMVVARPLSALAHPLRGCEVIGCLSDVPGGVLVREDRLAKLRMGELLRVAGINPGVAGNLPADRMCRRILQCWAGNQGLAVAETLIAVDPAPASAPASAAAVDPAAALAGADAVWPAHANTHTVAARLQGMAVRLVTTQESGLPSISALGLIVRQGRSAAEQARHATLLECLEAAAVRLASDLPAALELWRKSVGDNGGFAEAIVTATLPHLKAHIDRRPRDWQAFAGLLEDA